MKRKSLYIYIYHIISTMKKNVMWLIIGLVVLVVLVGGYYFIMNSNQTGSGQNQENSNQQLSSDEESYQFFSKAVDELKNNLNG